MEPHLAISSTNPSLITGSPSFNDLFGFIEFVAVSPAAIVHEKISLPFGMNLGAFLVQDSRVSNKPLGRSLCSFVCNVHSAHSLRSATLTLLAFLALLALLAHSVHWLAYSLGW